MHHCVKFATLLAVASLCAQAQWLHNLDPRAPRTADGNVNMAGPVPRVNDKPDLSGVWQIEGVPRGPELYGLGESTNSPFFGNILAGFKADEQPLTPEGVEKFRKNREGTGTKNPQSYCLPDGVPHGILLPEPFKVIQIPGETLFLYEVETIFRQIYTDGRRLPNPYDVRPTWYGYSVGNWDRDTFVVDTLGFNDLGWLDAGGHGHSEDLRVQERFTRRDFGHIDVALTITDAKTFTKPLTVNFVERLLPDTDVLNISAWRMKRTSRTCRNNASRPSRFDLPAAFAVTVRSGGRFGEAGKIPLPEQFIQTLIKGMTTSAGNYRRFDRDCFLLLAFSRPSDMIHRRPACVFTPGSKLSCTFELHLGVRDCRKMADPLTIPPFLPRIFHDNS